MPAERYVVATDPAYAAALAVPGLDAYRAVLRGVVADRLAV